MREIEFRGKRANNGEWIYGLLVKTVLGKYCIQEEKGEYKWKICTDVLPETVGQFTGLLDADGKKIYDGDIVSLPNKKPFKDFICAVKFDNGCFDICNEERNFRDYLKCWTCNHVAKKLGNIHDNPELLK